MTPELLTDLVSKALAGLTETSTVTVEHVSSLAIPAEAMPVVSSDPTELLIAGVGSEFPAQVTGFSESL